MKSNDRSVMYKDREKKRAAAQEKETRLMYKFICIVCLATLGIIAVMKIRENGVNTVNFLNAQLPIVIGCAVLTLAAAVNLIIHKVKKINENERVITSVSLFAAALGALLLFASYSFIDIGYDRARIIAIIVVALLYFVYHIYDALFFTTSVQCALGVLAVSVLAKTSLHIALRVAGSVAVIALCTLGAVLLARALAGKDSSVVKNYKFYIMSAIVIAGVLLSLAIPAISSYALFAILAVYVVNAVISTIELM
ncbi:MAG: hypothetical protein J6V93_01935 [Clostridia bacterium]|nr:hypothetical protein [Clostridia bacterium]